MLPGNLQELWDGMEENRKVTLRMVSGLSATDFGMRDEGEWSIAEILEHLVLAETGTSKLIRKLMKDNRGKLPPYPAADSAITVREAVRTGKPMTEAPEVAHPRGSHGKESILGIAAKTREATHASLMILAGADPRSVEFPHPYFGNMNLYEWPHRIIREHEKQHHPQIERVLRNLGK